MVTIVIGISFIVIFHNVRFFFRFSIIIIAIKRIAQKQGEKAVLLVADYFPAIGSSRRSFSADLTNIRARISDRRIQFHRDVISVFSAN